ncbi:hypothetical protein KC354_g68 [Hortaea werneckii]|nr:hypothetical protein KC354_g68 [Hortaea werneckii]
MALTASAVLRCMGEKYDYLLGGIEMALRFQNVEGDDESVELAKILKDNDANAATKKLTGLEETHPIFAKVSEVSDATNGQPKEANGHLNGHAK